MFRSTFALFATLAIRSALAQGLCSACSNEASCAEPIAGFQDYYTCTWDAQGYGSFTPPAGASGYIITVSGGSGGDAQTNSTSAGTAAGASFVISANSIANAFNLYVGQDGSAGSSIEQTGFQAAGFGGTGGQQGTSASLNGGNGGDASTDSGTLTYAVGGGGGGSGSYLQFSSGSGEIFAAAGAGGGSSNSYSGTPYIGGAAGIPTQGSPSALGANGGGPGSTAGLANGNGGTSNAGIPQSEEDASSTQGGDGVSVDNGAATNKEIDGGGGGGGGYGGPSAGNGNGGGGNTNYIAATGDYYSGSGAGGASYVDTSLFSITSSGASSGPQIVIQFTPPGSATGITRKARRRALHRAALQRRADILEGRLQQ